MENEHIEQSPNPNFTRRVGMAVINITAAYICIKIGGEVFNCAMPAYTELGVAAAIGAAATNN